MIEVKDKSKCCGCSACAAACPVGCISMEYDAEGCEYPLVDADRCIGCGKCERVCRILTPAPEKPSPQRAFLVQHRDPEVLLQSTSGGAFTALAQVVLSRGGVVFGHGYLRGEQLSRAEGAPGPLKVGCFAAEDASELWRFRNSKYVQSTIGPAYQEVKDHLDEGRAVLFSGTPCQCEGLLSFLGGKRAGLYVVDIVCHAIVCRSVFSAYCEWLESKTGETLEAVRFRDKERFGYRYSMMRALGHDGERPFGKLYSAGVESDPYLRAFFSDVSDRPSCYSCAFKKRYRESDVTLWDFFDVYRMDRTFDDNRGVTRALCHTEEGAALLADAAAYARVSEIDADDACEGVREMTRSVERDPRRDAFVSAVSRSGADSLDSWFPDSPRVKAERLVRAAAEKLGVYDQVKRAAKRLLRGYRRA
ncbi:Coenzyme F420 hydrogenase/dehydrogenase, beta subunit C-terminal domain [Collinsella tanakaei]|nr:Coenzyme F420 hydrogenase/dehydrogenase, beta subunit C-terminal domain [Collinsella tanakaei]